MILPEMNPDADSKYDYSRSRRFDYNGMGILAWYDNPDFEGEPITKTISFKEVDENDEFYYYAKLAPTITIYVNGIEREKQVHDGILREFFDILSIFL